MGLVSNFRSDLQKEQHLSILLDALYKKHLHQYRFQRISDLKKQLQGIDLILTRSMDQKEFLIDEKAQLDYVNDDLPTFAFEINYQKNGKTKQGWLFDPIKKTDFYALITGIYSDEPNKFTSCKITFVNREKLVFFLKSKAITENSLVDFMENSLLRDGKIKMPGLDSKTEGYLYYSKYNKTEKPINLVLKLDFLIENGLAKRLV
ncbi:MAG: hypothetical protein WBM98_02335 [Maribacter sp.]|uniref:hypothetical protein n=1 Tax=Maribacter sp. TaxID=1897614 RepID=UPI003C73E5A5